MIDDMLKFVANLGKGGEVRENYIVPGLTSRLLGRAAHGGAIRLFDMTREQELDITPHDHRYDFTCYVIRGSVVNRRYTVGPATSNLEATHAALRYFPDTHTTQNDEVWWYWTSILDEQYTAGQWYSMSHDEFHSIRFSNAARVLFIEGVPLQKTSRVLVPVVNGRICNTFQWRDWMMAAKEEGQ